MTNETGLGLCGWVCWVIGVIAGILAYLMSQGAVGWLPALLIGLAVAIFLGLVLRATFCKAAETGAAQAGETHRPADDADDDTGAMTAAMAAGGASAVAAGAGSAGAAADAESEAAAKDAAARAASEKAEAEKSAQAKAQTGSAAAPETKPEPAKAKTKKKAPAAKAPAAETTEKKPRTLKAPRKAGADDLKLIGGVGPKLEQTLNELGFWHFDQIAQWGPEEIAWVDSRLRFKGRIARDDWMSQAKTLAEGGETELSKKKRKG